MKWRRPHKMSVMIEKAGFSVANEGIGSGADRAREHGGRHANQIDDVSAAEAPTVAAPMKKAREAGEATGRGDLPRRRRPSSA